MKLDTKTLMFVTTLSCGLAGAAYAADPAQIVEVRKMWSEAPHNAFTDLVRFQTPSAKYRKHAFQVAQRRLALAGYRMGETFNRIFGAAPAPVSAH